MFEVGSLMEILLWTSVSIFFFSLQGFGVSVLGLGLGVFLQCGRLPLRSLLMLVARGSVLSV